MKRCSLPVLGLLVIFLVTTSTFAIDGSPVEIWPIVQAPVGAQQSYIATSSTTLQVVERQGLFLLQDLGSMESHVGEAEHITFTVLEPDPDGNVRLLVEAQPLDPNTFRPLITPKWTGIYVLHPSELLPTLEEGTAPESSLVGPDWLLWGHEMDDVSYGPMLPGEVRSMTFDDLGPRLPGLPSGDVDATMPIENASVTFVGWEDVGDGQTQSALLEVIGDISAEFVMDGALRMALSSAMVSSVYLVPGDFPWAVTEVLDGRLRNEVIPGAVPGLTGWLDADMVTTVSYHRTSPLTSARIDTIHQGDVYGGVLPAESWVLDDGSQAALFHFNGVQGEAVRITLESPDFDAYLMVLDEAWEVLAEDDDSAGGTNASLRFRLPYTGTYTIVANTYYEDEVGRYTLSLESLGREVDVDAMHELLEQGFQEIEAAAMKGDWEAVLELIEELLDQTRLQMPLGIGAVSLVTERAPDYGEYLPRASRVYRPGEWVHVYVEPQNFHTRNDTGRYEVHLTVDATLVDGSGNVVSHFPDVIVWNRITNRPTKEVALSVPLWLGEVPSGSYVWRLTLRDMVSGQSATAEVPIVVSTQASWSGGFS